MLEQLSIWRYYVAEGRSDNPTSAANQQERLPTHEAKCWFLAGLIEGEGSLCVSVKTHPTARFGFLVDPEFFIYQHQIRRGLLELAKSVFDAGRIDPKPGNEVVLVYSIRNLSLIAERVLPFYERYMAFSCKKRDYQLFRECVDAKLRKRHLDPHGMIEIVEKAYQMNMDGKQRKRSKAEVIGRILRDYTPNPLALSGEDIVRS
jgi:LAGLIDADG DNA endonuclease family protein